MTLQETMSENVRVLARVRGLSAGDLAAAMGMARTNVASKLVGRVRWNLDDLEAIAQALEVEPAELVSGVLELRAVRPKGFEPPTFCLIRSDDFGLCA